jgi:hypothetical protein
MLPALLLSCFGELSPPPPAPTLSSPIPPTPVVRYVTASSLNLRAAGAADAPRLGILSINSPVLVLNPGAIWAEVEVGNGAKGWVDAKYLSDSPVTVDHALRQAAAAADPAAVLSWRQRAAALSPLDRSLLTSLAEAYAAAGDAERAEEIRRQLTWPAGILPVERIGARGEVWLLVDTGLLEEAPFQGRPTLRRAEVLGYPGEKSWWVLPDIGAAVPARLDRYEQGVLNECAGDFGVWLVLRLEEPLPADRRPLVATAGPLPAVWQEATPAPLLSRAEATAKLMAFAEPRSGDAITVSLAPSGQTWLGVARWAITEEEDFFTTSEGVFVRISAETGVQLIREEPELDSLALIPYGQRDLDGDGKPETFWGGCEVDIFGEGGLLETSTPSTCCGC